MKRRDMLKASAAAPGALPALAQTAAWRPKVFDAHQNETVIALSECIIPATDTPGAKAAQVNRFLDLLLADGPSEQRHKFLEGLAWLDAYSIRKHAQPFVKLSLAEQNAVLEAFDKGSDPEAARGQAFFRMAKQYTSRIYYATEIGQRELNKGGRVPATFGCTHREHKI